MIYTFNLNITPTVSNHVTEVLIPQLEGGRYRVSLDVRVEENTPETGGDPQLAVLTVNQGGVGGYSPDEYTAPFTSLIVAPLVSGGARRYIESGLYYANLGRTIYVDLDFPDVLTDGDYTIFTNVFVDKLAGL